MRSHFGHFRTSQRVRVSESYSPAPARRLLPFVSPRRHLVGDTTEASSKMPPTDSDYSLDDQHGWQGANDKDPNQDDPSPEPQPPNPLQRTIDYVNHELSSAGFPLTLSFTHLTSDPTEASSILNCICTLLQQRQKDVAYREDLQHRLRRAIADNDDLNALVARLRAQGEALRREVKELANGVEKTREAAKRESEKHATTREELKTTKGNFQYAKTQYNHDLRKKEREFQRLKERLQRTVTEKSKVSITLLNPLSKPTPSSSPSSGQINNLKDAAKRQDELMYDVVMRNYEDREQELLKENQSLRDTLYETYTGLKDRFGEAEDVPEAVVGGPRREKVHDEEEAMARAHFQLPFSVVQNSVQQRIQMAILDFKDEWMRMAEVMDHKMEGSDEMKRKLEALEKNIEEYRAVIEEQGRLLEISMNGQFNKGDDAGGAGYDTSMVDLQEQRNEIEEARKQLDAERKRFTDAAIKLGMERAALQREKVAVQEERRAIETRALLQTLPDTPGPDDRTRSSSLQPMNTPSTLDNLSSMNSKYYTHSPADTGTPFGRTYSTVNPARDAPSDISSDALIESDTFAQTPRVPNQMRAWRRHQTGGVDDIVDTPVQDRYGYSPLGHSSKDNGGNQPSTTRTTPQQQSLIRSALKKQAGTYAGGRGGNANGISSAHSTPSSNARTVRITVDEDEGRSFRPGEGKDDAYNDAKENASPTSGPHRSMPMGSDTPGRKGFIATSTPNGDGSYGAAAKSPITPVMGRSGKPMSPDSARRNIASPAETLRRLRRMLATPPAGANSRPLSSVVE
ncbi:Afadin and alpha-actinin-binding-domain-containing protein [Fimicolochytrium jonesii]|uniref:Afadin and alpha-actinin-binding-domain-containing protein n=1 Tax=Fimicolochytrium jonesii TaxID=1396493 RepID=UPI0022FDE2E4|nr:Afadin and alpha-actinin-binding-domain-containing protein [Fimicolochytrium jonesii]KAI8818978.1 Afadin and alpha-actinin-binding-domain-containing protein [Fimicolochytrium jonesii]